MEVHLRRLHRLVAKPQCDHGAVHAVAQQFHRGGVAEDVRTHVFARERWTAPLRRLSMLSDEPLDGVPTERSAADTGENGIGRLPVTFAQPRRDQGRGLSMQRRTSLLAPFPVAPDVRARAERHVGTSELDQLGHAEPGLNRQDQEQAIPSADPRRRVGRRHQGIDLFATQEGDRSSLVALGGDRQNATTAIGVGRFVAEALLSSETV